MTADVQSARDALIEMVAENDEKLMEHFFEAGTLTDEELTSGLRSATLAGKLFPLVCTSAVANVGVPQLLDAIVDCLPSPVDRPFIGRDVAGAEVLVRGRRPASVVDGRLEDDRRSVRRSNHHVPRGQRHREGRLHRAEPLQGHA